LTEITKDGDVYSVEANPELEDVIHFIQKAKNATDPQIVRSCLVQAEITARCLLTVQNAR
jgi:hypothetical protein